MCGRTRHRPPGGFTLVEMMIVVAIVGLMLGAATMTVRSVARSELRSGASRAAATLRYAFDRATMTGNTIRVVLDLEKGEIWLEMSEDRVALRSGKEQHHTTDEKEAATDDDEDDKPQGGLGLFGLGGGAAAGGEGEESDEGGLGFGVDAAELKRKWERDLAPVSRPKALFKPIDKKKKIKLAERVSIDAVVTPRLVEPVEEGKALIYFFPQGHGEPAIIHLVDQSEEYYSVVLHPLTGQAKVYACMYPIPDDFGIDDDKRSRKKGGEECGEGGL